VFAVAVGISMALFNSGGDKNNNAAGSSSSSSAGATNSSSASAAPSQTGALPSITDASTMTLKGTAPAATPPGAKAAAGSVAITNGQQSVSWTVTIPTAGQYYVHIRYNNPTPGTEAKDLLLVNGQKSRETSFKNYGGKDPSQTWFHTYNQPDLPAGQVVITIQGVDGQPPVSIDQLTITDNSSNPWGS
jgi:hypothetical protein